MKKIILKQKGVENSISPTEIAIPTDRLGSGSQAKQRTTGRKRCIIDPSRGFLEHCLPSIDSSNIQRPNSHIRASRLKNIRPKTLTFSVSCYCMMKSKFTTKIINHPKINLESNSKLSIKLNNPPLKPQACILYKIIHRIITNARVYDNENLNATF